MSLYTSGANVLMSGGNIVVDGVDAPQQIFLGPVQTTRVVVGLWPTPAATESGYYFYRNTVPNFATATKINPGSPIVGWQGGTGATPVIWINDTTVSPGTTYYYWGTAIFGTGEGPPSATLTVTTRANVASIAPTPPADPAGWIQSYSLPVGGTTWTCTNLSSSQVAGTGANNATNCSLPYALAHCNVAGGDVLVLSSYGTTGGVPYPFVVTLPNFTGTNGWTYIVSDQDPGYNGSGTLPTYSTATPTYVSTATSALTGATFSGTISGNTLTVSSVTGTIAIGQGLSSPASALFASAGGIAITPGTTITGGSGTTWTISGAGQTISTPQPMYTGPVTIPLSGSWAYRSGWWVTLFIESSGSANGGATIGEIRRVIYTHGSSTATVVGPPIQNAGGTTGTVVVEVGPWVTPSDMNSMAFLQMTPANGGVGWHFPGTTSQAPNKVRFVGVGAVPAPNNPTSTTYGAWQWSYSFPLGDGTTNSTGIVPADSIYIDRCFTGNDSTQSTFSIQRAGVLEAFCNHLLISQCYFQDIYGGSGPDSYAIGIDGGQYICVDSNFLCAASEGCITGGAYTDINHQPTDLVRRNNSSFKEPAWALLPGTTSINAETKNHLECKTGIRVADYNNRFYHNWFGAVGGQHGRAVAYGTRDQNASTGSPILNTCPWTTIQDVDCYNNIAFYVGSLAYVFHDNYDPVCPTRRVRVRNNVCWCNPWPAVPYPVPGNAYTTDARGIFVGGQVADFICDHNTFIINPTNAYLAAYTAGIYAYGGTYGGPGNNGSTAITTWQDGATITNSVLDGVYGTGGDSHLGPSAITTYFNTGNLTFNKNIMVLDAAAYPSYPGGGTNYAAVGYGGCGFSSFVNNSTLPWPFSSWDITTGTYATAATDGGAIGATL